MTSSLQQFLTELYAIDPALKAHEAELKPLIKKLLASDPAEKPSPAFVARLREQLHDHGVALSSKKSFSFQNLWYALGGVAVAAVILPLAFISLQKDSVAPGTPLFVYQVEDAGSEAFGSLADIDTASTGARPQSGGGGGDAQLGNAEAMSATRDAYGTMDEKMLIYPYVRYSYIYDGEIEGLESLVSVYKKNSSRTTVPLSSIIGSFNIGTFDLGSFDGMSVDSISLTQDKSFGYQIYVNMRDSSVGIDAQWDQWPQSKCQTEACYQAERVKLEDIPADDVLISIAKDFASSHNIDLSHYGEPEVDKAWRADYERATDTSLAYIPDTQNVIFPLLLDGKPVYDQGGMKNGIQIAVNVKHKRVANVWGITDRSYQKSDYTGITDAATIKTYLSNIDQYPGMEKSADQKEETVKLGTPTLSFALYYRYANNRSEELVVPSLIFPVEEVTGETAGGYYRRTIVVPLAVDLLKEQGDMGRPMPLIMEDAVRSE